MTDIVDAPVRQIAVITPRDLVTTALSQGAPIEQLERLWALQVAYERHEAEKQFNQAMSDFKAAPPEILKDKLVSFDGAKGKTEYHHATHFGVTTAIAAALSKHGLSHSWTSTQEKGEITVTCTIKHRAGHSISTSMTAAYDGSGGKNPIQAISSAKTYLERITFLGVTGMSTKDVEDDDGAAAGVPPAAVEGVLQGLLADVARAKTDAAAVVLWEAGKKTLATLGDAVAYDEFKAAVVTRRQAIKEGKVS